MPLDPKLTKFSTASPQIISYSYTDVADGTGKQKFYFVRGATRFLTDQVLYSQVIEEYKTTESDTVVLIATENYDLQPFNISRVIGGVAIYEIGTWTRDSGGSPSTGRIIIKVQHWDGSNAITLGTVTILDTTNVATLDKVKTGIFTITRKPFRKGDILRVAVEFWGRSVGGGGERQIAMGTDPINRDGTHILPATTDNITKSAIYIPFEIQE